MGVGIGAVDLQRLVVAVLGGDLRLDCVVPQHLELHPDERPEYVVEQRLVNVDLDTLAGGQFAVRQMRREHLSGDASGIGGHTEVTLVYIVNPYQPENIAGKRYTMITSETRPLAPRG